MQTMRHCVRLLKPEGLLLIQTPRYPEGKSLEVMRKDGDRFVVRSPIGAAVGDLMVAVPDPFDERMREIREEAATRLSRELDRAVEVMLREELGRRLDSGS